MDRLAYLVSYLFAAMGLTILVVWPQDGPSAWLRERVLRVWLPSGMKRVLDCYLCAGFWAGLLLSPVWWILCGQDWVWAGCLMTPALFWIVLRNPGNSNP